MKSHTPECAKIEQVASALVPAKTYLACVQDFKTKDYTLDLQRKSITVTKGAELVIDSYRISSVQYVLNGFQERYGLKGLGKECIG